MFVFVADGSFKFGYAGSRQANTLGVPADRRRRTGECRTARSEASEFKFRLRSQNSPPPGSSSRDQHHP
jgi:hypothetical protein